MVLHKFLKSKFCCFFKAGDFGVIKIIIFLFFYGNIYEFHNFLYQENAAIHLQNISFQIHVFENTLTSSFMYTTFQMVVNKASRLQMSIADC